jgi:hypothetical protein
LTKSDKTEPNKTGPLAGGVRHDARGNAVWHWATETARHAVATTSKLLRRLDVSSLSLQDDESLPNAPDMPAPAKPARYTPASPMAALQLAAPARHAPGGFNPYDAAAVPAAAALKKRCATQAPARAGWWRRLFQRR